MANALNQLGVFRNYFAGKDDAAGMQQENALAQMRQTQFGQQSALFDQQQQDRRKQVLREDVMGATAAVIMASPQERAALYGQLVPQLKQQHPELAQVPDQYDEGKFTQFIGSSGFFPPEVAQKIVMERFAPKPQAPIAVSPGTTLLDPETRRPIYTSPTRPTASGRPIPVVDAKSPTGFAYQTPDAAVGSPAPAPRSPSNTRYSQREMQAARDKLRLIGLARQQLNRVIEAWRGKTNEETGERGGGIKDSFSAGPLSTWMTYTEGGDLFDSAVSQLTPAIAAITRVPGVGAMSDYETRLQEATRPQRGRFEATTQSQIEGVTLLLDQLEAGYGGIIEDGQEAGGSDLTVEDLIEHYAGQE